MMRLCNIIYYNFIRLQQFFQNIIRALFRFILNTKKVKAFEERVEDIEKLEKTKNAFFADVYISTLFLLLILSPINYISGFVKYKFDLNLIHFILMGGGVFVINYLLLYKDDKYLDYFREFDKMSKEKKQKSAWLTLIVVISIWAFFIGSLFVENWS